ncbi:MAG: hypothetical protein QG608_3309, partial [Actinomycetota bacterium]|nr:hypothetical protein [Actinomycetota bacterium]
DHAMPPELREDPPAAPPGALARSGVALFLRGAGTRPT